MPRYDIIYVKSQIVISRKGIVFFRFFLYTDSTKSLISSGLVERPRSICGGEVPRHFFTHITEGEDF